jgi:hypothetical protein
MRFQRIPDLRERVAKVVMQHERRAQLDRQPRQASPKLVLDGVRLTRVIDLAQRSDLAFDIASAARATCLAIALADEQPMDPGFETVGITERPQVAPGDEQLLLGGVLGPVGVSQDEPSDGVEPTNHEPSQL